MGKNNRSRKRRLKYSQEKFVKFVCIEQCGLCTPGGPEFCYEMYRLNPKKFMKFGINSILEAEDFVSSITDITDNELKNCSDEEIQYVFEEFFCDSKLCGRSGKGFCKELPGCLLSFRRQLRGEGKVIVKTRRKKKNRQNSKYHTKPTRNPTPTFFCNDSFMDEVTETLYGNNCAKQDSIEKCTTTNSESTCGTTSNNQS